MIVWKLSGLEFLVSCFWNSLSCGAFQSLSLLTAFQSLLFIFTSLSSLHTLRFYIRDSILVLKSFNEYLCRKTEFTSLDFTGGVLWCHDGLLMPYGNEAYFCNIWRLCNVFAKSAIYLLRKGIVHVIHLWVSFIKRILI